MAEQQTFGTQNVNATFVGQEAPLEITGSAAIQDPVNEKDSKANVGTNWTTVVSYKVPIGKIFHFLGYIGYASRFGAVRLFNETDGESWYETNNFLDAKFDLQLKYATMSIAAGKQLRLQFQTNTSELDVTKYVVLQLIGYLSDE